MDAATTGSQPHIFDKNMGEKLDEASLDLTRTNADGLPVVELTQEQKYVFDKDGWLLFPGVLADDDIEDMRAFCVRLATDPESIPEHERSPIGGPLQKLTDHPLVIGFMNEFVAYPALASQACYGFRHESAYLQYREFGSDNFGPHNGNGLMRFEGDSHIYRQIPGKAHAGLTRVVWELNPVEKDGGGTLFVSGSHKAAFTAPESIQDRRSPLWETYACPAGSLLFFTEAITHSGDAWRNKGRNRIGIFSCYNTVNAKWHKWEPHPELLASMPPKRRTLYRPVHAQDNLVGEPCRG
jgi:hypothetical protein